MFRQRVRKLALFIALAVAGAALVTAIVIFASSSQ